MYGEIDVRRASGDATIVLHIDPGEDYRLFQVSVAHFYQGIPSVSITRPVVYPVWTKFLHTQWTATLVKDEIICLQVGMEAYKWVFTGTKLVKLASECQHPLEIRPVQKLQPVEPPAMF